VRGDSISRRGAARAPLGGAGLTHYSTSLEQALLTTLLA
jgi:hypothetical protein